MNQQKRFNTFSIPCLWIATFLAVFSLTVLCAPAPATAQVCGNGVCEGGEDSFLCPDDCPTVCGDGVCGVGEAGLCPQDCDPEGLCGNGVCDDNEEGTTCAPDCAPDCGDGLCEDALGEDCNTCPTDCCDVTTEPACGNGVCETGEDPSVCTADCGTSGSAPPPPPPAPVCGDGTCDLGENPCNCDPDCGPLGAPSACNCGDGVCSASDDEDCASCSEDCGDCAPASTGVCGDDLCEEEKGENCFNCSADCGNCPEFPEEILAPPTDPAEQSDGLDPAFAEHWEMDLSLEEYAVSVVNDASFEVATPLSGSGGDGRRDVVYRVAGSTLGTTLSAADTWNFWAVGVRGSNGMTVVCWNRLSGDDSNSTTGTMPDPRGGVQLICAVDSGQGFEAETVIENGQPAAWIVDVDTDAQGRPTVTYLRDSFGTLINTGKPGDDLMTVTFEPGG